MATGPVNAASFNSALKEYYTDDAVRNVVYENNPWFAMVAKNENVDGKYFVQPLQYGIGQGRSATFSTAQANKSTNNYVDFNIPMRDDFGLLSIERKVMKQSKSQRGAFFQARVRETDGMLQALARSTSIALFGNGSGAIGRIASGEGTPTITLTDVEDITNFEQDSRLVVSTSNDGVSGSVKAGSVLITAVDRDAGTVTASANWDSGIATIAAGDYIFYEGDFNAKIVGLGGWIPDTAPTGGDNFFGVDRSVDPTRLAGSRISAVGIPLLEAWQNGATRLGREGAYPDIGYCSHAQYNNLAQELQNRAVNCKFEDKSTGVGFTGLSIIAGKSTVQIYPDHNCPDNRMYLLTKNTWDLLSLGPVPDMVDDDGVSMLRETSAAAYEIRADLYANLCCVDPRANCVIKLD